MNGTDGHALDPHAVLSESRWVLRLARSLIADPGTADDVAQEAMVAALERRPALRDGSIRAWLGAVVRNLASKQRRGAARRTKHELHGARDERVVPSPEALAASSDALGAVMQELVHLGDEDREVITLRYLRECDSTEIARQLGIPAGTVRWRLKRALGRLRARMDDRWDGRRDGWVGALTAVCLPVGTRAVGSSLPLFAAAAAVLVLGGAAALFTAGLLPKSGVDATLPSSEAPAVSSVAQLSTGAGAASESPIVRTEVAGHRTAVESDSVPLPPGYAGISARLVHPDGAPVRSGRMQWTSSPDTLASAADGQVALRVQPIADSSRITVEALGSRTAVRRVRARVRVGTWTDLGEIVLPGVRHFGGGVVNAEGTGVSGAAVFAVAPDAVVGLAPGATPRVWNEWRIPVTATAADGGYSIRNLPDLPLRLVAVRSDTEFAWSEVLEPGLSSAEAGAIDLVVRPRSTGLRIGGRVVDAVGRPVAGADVICVPDPTSVPDEDGMQLVAPWWFSEMRRTTGEDGSFSFPVRPGRRFEVQAYLDERGSERETDVMPGAALRLVLAP